MVTVRDTQHLDLAAPLKELVFSFLLFLLISEACIWTCLVTVLSVVTWFRHWILCSGSCLRYLEMTRVVALGNTSKNNVFLSFRISIEKTAN